LLLTILKDCQKEFDDDKDNVSYFKAVQQTFDAHPKNVNMTDVALKFAVLNELYSTHIMATYKMISHILKLATEENLDNLLKSGDPAAVEKIRKGHRILGTNKKRKNKKQYDFYSFATKYCHFSNPNGYSIYDQYVDRALMRFRKDKDVQFFDQNDLYHAASFIKIIDNVKKKANFSDYQQLDRALWIYGKRLERSAKRKKRK
jgi:hypothetical protein